MKSMKRCSSSLLEGLTVHFWRCNIPQINSEWLPARYQQTARANDQKITNCGYGVPVINKQVLNIFCDHLELSQK